MSAEFPQRGVARLSQRAGELVEQLFRGAVIPIYFRTELTLDEQVRQRGKPLPYLMVAAKLVREFSFKTIVEIGSMREPMQHRLDEFNPYCCNDGHSTLHWAATGAELFTTDVDPRCAEILQPSRNEFPNLHIFTEDGNKFLKGFDRTIDVLYLDAWDVVAGTNYAEAHLEAYQTARPRLSARCLIQIDDTDILNGGKGRLAIPQMIRDGFELITWGRQAILVREP